MGRVGNKVALVTGAAQGLGAAIASMLANEGASVMLTDINADGAASMAASINKQRANCAASLHQDVTDEKRWGEVLDGTVERFGGLNVLVNNAGIGSVGSIEDESLEKWH
ncbi:MAG TPA: SDR family NAD(P)-dependent oxidoreductase, partial [Woeseiaceae bacterium]